MAGFTARLEAALQGWAPAKSIFLAYVLFAGAFLLGVVCGLAFRENCKGLTAEFAETDRRERGEKRWISLRADPTSFHLRYTEVERNPHFWQSTPEVGRPICTRPGSDHRRKRWLPIEIVIGIADSGVKDYAACVIPQGDGRAQTLRSTSIFA